MKNKLSIVITVVLLSVTMINCSKKDDFSSYNGAIKGTVKDNSGLELHGDLNSNNIIVRLLGEGDQSPTDIRVNGDGNYQNTKMFPKVYLAWIEGPVVKSDTVSVNLQGKGIMVQDFVVTPLILAKVMNGTVSGKSVTVDYSLLENAGNLVDKKEVYCSTVPYPTASTGSLTNVYFTKTVQLPSISGGVMVDGLASGKYYIRIGARAKGSVLMNYSNQIIITIP